MKQSQHFLENAENCAQMAERAPDEPTHNRYKRMEAAWRALASEQDWLDGQVPPARIAANGDAQKTPPVRRRLLGVRYDRRIGHCARAFVPVTTHNK
jgi:hypothetical protein